MHTKGFVAVISEIWENESIWNPWVLMQTCKASYPSDTSTMPLPSLPAPPPPQEPLLIEQVPKEEEISLCLFVQEK